MEATLPLHDFPQQETVTDALALTRAPDVVLEEARKAAVALTDVIEKKTKKIKFNGRTYLQFEDWQTLGRFYGVTAIVKGTHHVEYGEGEDKVAGFEATAEALLVSTNQVISAAEALCLNDEPNWSKKPLFQLKSMAQTRACAKALRNVLAWIVVLAGYAPTPAEEMSDEFDEGAPLGNFQMRAWAGALESTGKTKAQIETWLQTTFRHQDVSKLTRLEFDRAIKWLVSNEPLQQTLETSVAAARQNVPSSPTAAPKRTEIARLEGEAKIVSVSGEIASMAQRSKGDKTWLNVKMADGVELSAWNLKWEESLKPFIGKQIEFLCRVSSAAGRTYYTIESIDVPEIV
jgi:hypothetical protein